MPGLICCCGPENMFCFVLIIFVWCLHYSSKQDNTHCPTRTYLRFNLRVGVKGHRVVSNFERNLHSK